MNKIIFFLSLASVYPLSWLLGEAYIHVLIGIVSFHLLIAFVSPNDQNQQANWKKLMLLGALLTGLIALNVYFPVLEAFGAI